MRPLVRFSALLAGSLWSILQGASIRALLIEDPKGPAPVRGILQATGLFQFDAASESTNFEKYKVVVMNGAPEGWPTDTLVALERYLMNGGGLVVLPPAAAAFPEWPEYNQMLGVTAAKNRDQRAGPLWFYRAGNIVFDDKTPGAAGKILAPGKPFLITIRNTEHPVTKGLPLAFLHAPDELAGNIRGPGKNMSVLATALSDAEQGTGRDEPQIIVVNYGKGRVFNSILGRTPEGMECAGLQTLIQRGAEWAATGKVTQRVPADFPTEEKVSARGGGRSAAK